MCRARTHRSRTTPWTVGPSAVHPVLRIPEASPSVHWSRAGAHVAYKGVDAPLPRALKHRCVSVTPPPSPWPPSRWKPSPTGFPVGSTIRVPPLGPHRAVRAARFLSLAESSPEPSSLRPPPPAAGKTTRRPSSAPGQAPKTNPWEVGTLSPPFPGRARWRARWIPASRAGQLPRGPHCMTSNLSEGQSAN
jgi:hypothetical protein